MIALLAVVLFALPGRGAVNVLPALPLTNTVTIQPIRVQTSDGSYSATVFGDPNGFADGYIKEQINVVLAQSAINANWLPVIGYADSFTLNGHPNNYQTAYRPQNDLYTIRNNTPTPPKHTDPLVLNMFFVDIVPGFNNIGDWSVGGIAVVDANGMVIAGGDELLTYYGGLETIAAVVAHEIGHNLGLDHTSPGSDNLMATYNGTSEKLTAGQTTIVFTNNFGTDGFEFLAPYVPPTHYSVWADDHDLAGGYGDDDDGDRLANVLEFMLDRDPQSPDQSALPTPVWNATGLTWTIPKLEDALDDGLTYGIEVSTNGSHWFPAGATGSASTVVNDDDSSLVVRLDADSTPNFMRLAIDLSPALLPGVRSAAPPDAAEDLLPAIFPRISGCSPQGCGCGGDHQ